MQHANSWFMTCGISSLTRDQLQALWEVQVLATGPAKFPKFFFKKYAGVSFESDTQLNDKFA